MKRLLALAILAVCAPLARAQSIAHSFKGTCSNANVSESDGVQARPANGQMSTKDYMALMKRVRESHLKLGSDGFLWSTRSLNCDSVAIVDDKGHTVVAFSNDPTKTVLMLAGERGDGPLFFSDAVNLGSGPDIQLNPSQASSCYFYFTDHGTFTQGWEGRLTIIECELRMKTEAGHLISAKVRFTRASL
jgi:hypothetical protein